MLFEKDDLSIQNNIFKFNGVIGRKTFILSFLLILFLIFIFVLTAGILEQTTQVMFTGNIPPLNVKITYISLTLLFWGLLLVLLYFQYATFTKRISDIIGKNSMVDIFVTRALKTSGGCSSIILSVEDFVDLKFNKRFLLVKSINFSFHLEILLSRLFSFLFSVQFFDSSALVIVSDKLKRGSFSSFVPTDSDRINFSKFSSILKPQYSQNFESLVISFLQFGQIIFTPANSIFITYPLNTSLPLLERI